MMRLPVLLVVVLYRCPLESSGTLQSLLKAKAAGMVPEALWIFDNEPSPGNETSPMLASLDATYEPSATNRGICPGYERARLAALHAGIEWLWLFDQDSDFDPAFMLGMGKAWEVLARDAACWAILPRVFSEGSLVSPLARAALPPAERDGYLPASADARAINSGMMLRRRFVDGLGGFDQRFWLDGLDHWLCLSARSAGQRTGVATAVLQHALSVTATTGFVSVARYRSILAAERLLFQEHYTSGERVHYLARLLYRCVKQPLRWKSFAYLSSNLAQLWRVWV